VAISHVIDTSVLTRLSNKAVQVAVAELAGMGELARAGVSDLEVGFSARSAREWDELMKALAAFELVETESSHVTRARQVQRLLAAKSQRGRKVPDLLVAAAAEAAGATVLHYDADFELINSVTGQPCQWVVSPGTID